MLLSPDTSFGYAVERDPRDVEIEALRRRLDEAEATIHAIRHGEVDALVVTGPAGAQVFTLESADHPYRLLIEEMQEGAVTLSEDGVILYCNKRFAEMLGVPHERVVASKVRSYVAAKDVSRFDALLAAAANSSGRAEINLTGAKGRSLQTYITVSPLPQGVRGGQCMVVTDLTEQQSMLQKQTEIEELNARLQRSVTETHHRVKNNLQLITAMIDMQVMNGATSLPADELKRLIAHVRTLAVVHDLLTIDAREGGQATNVSGKAVLERLVPLLIETAGGRNIRMHLDEAQLTSRQATSLAIVASELVSNALKHGRGEVELTFIRGATEARLEVCDDGPGFNTGFNPSALDSTGIGLVENLSRWDLSGTVAYGNRPGGGARVSISLPVAATTAEVTLA